MDVPEGPVLYVLPQEVAFGAGCVAAPLPRGVNRTVHHADGEQSRGAFESADEVLVGMGAVEADPRDLDLPVPHPRLVGFGDGAELLHIAGIGDAVGPAVHVVVVAGDHEDGFPETLKFGCEERACTGGLHQFVVDVPGDDHEIRPLYADIHYPGERSARGIVHTFSELGVLPAESPEPAPQMEVGTMNEGEIASHAREYP